MKTVRDCLAEIYSLHPEAELFTGEEQYDKVSAFAMLDNRLDEEAAIEWWDEEFVEEYGVAGNFSILGQVEYNIFPLLELLHIDFD